MWNEDDPISSDVFSTPFFQVKYNKQLYVECVDISNLSTYEVDRHLMCLKDSQDFFYDKRPV